MAGEVEDYISSSYVAENFLSGSVSFGRFEIESLSWERRSCFLHNRYLEEVEKYSTPGSVTKKKEYFEAQFRKKALLHQISEESLKEKLPEHTESINADNDNLMGDFIRRENCELTETSCNSPHNVEGLLKEEMSSAELNATFQTLCGEKYAQNCHEISTLYNAIQTQAGINGVQLENETQSDDVNGSKECGIAEIPLKIVEMEENYELHHMKTIKTSMKESGFEEQTASKAQSKSRLFAIMAPKITPRNNNSASNGSLGKIHKQNNAANVEKGIPLKAPLSSSTDNSNFKINAVRNRKAKGTSESRSGEGAIAKKAEAKALQVERRERAKLVSKSEDKQCCAAFNFKSSERAEKRKEYNLKLEERNHAKKAELHEIQAKTEEVKEAEIKQFRRSLNFKATPMPSFYNESTSKASEGKKANTMNKDPSARAPRENPQHCERCCSPSLSSAGDDFSSLSKKSGQHDKTANNLAKKKAVQNQGKKGAISVHAGS